MSNESAGVMQISRPYLKIADLAARYGVSRRTIYRWQRNAEKPFPAATLNAGGVNPLWSAEEVLSWEAGFRLAIA